MAGKDRERELARRRLERQQARRRARQQAARRRTAYISAGVATLLVIGGVSYAALRTNGSPATAGASPTATPTSAARGVACNGTIPDRPKKLTFDKEPPLTVDKSAAYTMTLQTSCGEIDVALDAAKAPHTVNTLNFLAGKGYYDGTFCHRMTTVPTLTVLQCGDPTGTGEGGPGFTLPEENLTGAKYTRGIMAMAKTSAPHSTGSQFFLIDKDSQLPPQYTVVGKITKGLDVLDKIIAIGEDDHNGQGDGRPNQRVYLDKVTVRKLA